MYGTIFYVLIHLNENLILKKGIYIIPVQPVYSL